MSTSDRLILLSAAVEMRENWDDPRQEASDFMLAVADWLESVSENHDETACPAALSVARAYLG